MGKLFWGGGTRLSNIVFSILLSILSIILFQIRLITFVSSLVKRNRIVKQLDIIIHNGFGWCVCV